MQPFFSTRFVSKAAIFASCFFCLSIMGLHASSSALAQGEEDIALLDRTSKAFSTVVKKAGPAVVHVAVEKKPQSGGIAQFPQELFADPFFEKFFGPEFKPRNPQGRDGKGPKTQAAGSGFIISSDGYILTNNHVVGGAEKITVRIADQREFKARIIGADPQSDVAIIKIEGANLPVLPLGDSDKLDVGEWVIAIGSPFELNQTVTVGVVSAKGRNRMGITDYENFIQTDAAINPGNSGGPLLNIHGEAVGMNTAIFSRNGGYMGIGFAIPINMVKNIEKQLRSGGKVTRGWLGVLIQDVTEELAKQFKTQNIDGALVSDITPGSPAQRAGLSQGDIIVAMNGAKITNVADLRNRIAEAAPNSEVTLKVVRDGQEKEIRVTVGEQPKDMASLQKKPGVDSSLSSYGLSLQNLNADLADELGYEKNQGVLIAEVNRDSIAAEAGLQSGQLIEEVNRIRVRSVAEVGQALQKAGNKKEILLRIRAGRGTQYIVLRNE